MATNHYEITRTTVINHGNGCTNHSSTSTRPPLPFKLPSAETPGSEHDTTIFLMIERGHSWADIEAIAGEGAFERYYAMLDPELESIWTLARITSLNQVVQQHCTTAISRAIHSSYSIMKNDKCEDISLLPWEKISESLGQPAGACMHVWRTFGDGRLSSEEEKPINIEEKEETKKEKVEVRVTEVASKVEKKYEDTKITERKGESLKKEQVGGKKGGQETRLEEVELQPRTRIKDEDMEIHVSKPVVVQMITPSSPTLLPTRSSSNPSPSKNPPCSWKTMDSVTPVAPDLIGKTDSSKKAVPKEPPVLTKSEDETTRGGRTRMLEQERKLNDIRQTMEWLSQTTQKDMEQRQREIDAFIHSRATFILHNQHKKLPCEMSNFPSSFTANGQEPVSVDEPRPRKRQQTGSIDWDRASQPPVRILESSSTASGQEPVSVDEPRPRKRQQTGSIDWDRASQPPARILESSSTANGQEPESVDEPRQRKRQQTGSVDWDRASQLPARALESSSTADCQEPVSVDEYRPRKRQQTGSTDWNRVSQPPARALEPDKQSPIMVIDLTDDDDTDSVLVPEPSQHQCQQEPPQPRLPILTNTNTNPYYDILKWTADDIDKTWDSWLEVGDNWEFISTNVLNGKHSPFACQAFIMGKGVV